ncbi:MAG: RNA ligase family protein [Phototrophicaceae bacterium]
MSDKNNLEIYKYPRTYHIEGSKLQHGDEGMGGVSFRSLAGRYLVVEEKVDGANTAISFDDAGNLLLQSRGHYLIGGPREKHFALFKQWAYTHMSAFYEVLGNRYIMYGEWLYARHTVFYNHLPHYFMEFDIFDKQNNTFLSTDRRHDLLKNIPVHSVKVLEAKTYQNLDDVLSLVKPSNFIKGEHLQDLGDLCGELNLDAERAIQETDTSGMMEGLYLKIEEDGIVQERYKFVRADFLSKIQESNTHWLSRPIIPNQLAPDVDIFSQG